jgi:metal-responsive CopG/Arc/MetJ family transcriptional regulator
MDTIELNLTEEESRQIDIYVKEAGYSSRSECIKEFMLYIIEPELSDEILREISIARAQKQRGEILSLREVKDQLGL